MLVRLLGRVTAASCAVLWRPVGGLGTASSQHTPIDPMTPRELSTGVSMRICERADRHAQASKYRARNRDAAPLAPDAPFVAEPIRRDGIRPCALPRRPIAGRRGYTFQF